MISNGLTAVILIATVIVILALVYWGLRSIGLQEADDPSETKPEDLSEFEKRHTHRRDIQPKP